MQLLTDEGKGFRLLMNVYKTKTMVFRENTMPRKICIDGNELENVEKFTYLGSNVTYD